MNRRELLSSFCKVSGLALVSPLVALFFQAPEPRKRVYQCTIHCFFPREMSPDDYVMERSRWEDTGKLGALNQEFRRQQRLLSEEIEFQPRFAKWTVVFDTQEAFITWEQELLGVYDERLAKEQGFVPQFKGKYVNI